MELPEKVPVTNNTAMPMYVGATMIPAGETRHFDRQDVPPYLLPAEPAPIGPEEPEEDPLALLLEGTVKEVTDALPGMGIHDLERLGDLEQTGQNRKGVLSALSEAILAEAAKNRNAGGPDGTGGPDSSGKEQNPVG